MVYNKNVSIVNNAKLADMRNMPFRSQTVPAALALALAAAVTIGLVVVMARTWPIGPDYYFTFRPAAEMFLLGETRLYDQETLGFFNAPWTLLFFVPLTALSLRAGQAVLTVGTLLMLLASTGLAREGRPFPGYALVFALLNLHTFDLLIRGQIEVSPCLVLRSAGGQSNSAVPGGCRWPSGSWRSSRSMWRWLLSSI